MSSERPADDLGRETSPAAEKQTPLATSPSLLQRARAHDQRAWDRMYYLYRPLVLYWGACWGVHHEDADDLAQDVFREVTESLNGFRQDAPGSTFRGWLRGITRNLVLMHFRNAGRRVPAEGGSASQVRLEQVADQRDEERDESPEQISALYHRALELVRAEFAERTWQMFWQTAVEGRLPADVAADLGASDASVRQAKSRVLRRLKDEVGDLIT